VGAAPFAAEIGDVGARFQHQRAAQLAVQRVLDNDVQHFAAMIDQNLELFLGALGLVPAGEDSAHGWPGGRGNQIAPGRSLNLRPGGAQNRQILDDALTADPELPGEMAALHGSLAGAQQGFNFLATRAAFAGPG